MQRRIWIGVSAFTIQHRSAHPASTLICKLFSFLYMHRLLSAFLVLLSSCLAETLTSCLLLILEIKNYFKCTFTFTVNTLKRTHSLHQKHQIIYETKKQSRQRYLFRNKFFCFDFLKNAHISMYWCSSKPLSLLILFLLLTWSLSSSLSFLFPFLLSSFLTFFLN